MGKAEGFGDRVRRARLWYAFRRCKDFSNRDLARRLGIDVSTAYRWETENREPDTETVKRVAGLLGVRPAYLLFGDETDLPWAGLTTKRPPKTGGPTLPARGELGGVARSDQKRRKDSAG